MSRMRSMKIRRTADFQRRGELEERAVIGDSGLLVWDEIFLIHEVHGRAMKSLHSGEKVPIPPLEPRK
jgi:hypothetical protein